MHPKGTIFTCEQCAVAFTPKEARSKGRFCSRACWRAYESEHRHKSTCRQCGGQFDSKPANRARGWDIYCSRACYDTADRPKRPLEMRLWKRVRKTDGCWLWTGFRDTNGYGRMGRGGRTEGPQLVHRLSWELHYGRIPEGLFVCHQCDQPACVRPDHLFLGTHKDNMQDMMRKLRARNQFSVSGPPALALRWYWLGASTTSPSTRLRSC